MNKGTRCYDCCRENMRNICIQAIKQRYVRIKLLNQILKLANIQQTITIWIIYPTGQKVFAYLIEKYNKLVSNFTKSGIFNK